VAHFEREVRAFLRPEMFNRLDRIVPFAPLSQETIVQIARRELARAMRRDGLRLKRANIDIDESAIAAVAEGGYDPRYGARPLKRAIERRLVAPLAEALNHYGSEVAIECRVQAPGGKLEILTRARPLGAPSPLAGRAGAAALDAIESLVELRRQAQSLQRCGVVLRIKNEIARLRHAERQRAKRQKRRGEAEKFVFTPQQAAILAQEELLARIDKLAAAACDLEEQATCRLYADEPLDLYQITDQRDAHAATLRGLLFELYQSQSPGRKQLVVAIYGQTLNRVLELCRAYEAILAGEPLNLGRHWLKIYKPDLDVPPEKAARAPAAAPHELPVLHLKSRKLHEGDPSKKVVDVYTPPPELFHSLPQDAIGVALQIYGARGPALLETESGRHLFVAGGKPEVCLVETHYGPLAKYDPPADAGRQSGQASDIRVRRTYDFPGEICGDPLLGEELRLARGGLAQAVRDAVELYLTKRTWALLDGWN
jgi:hypothetical protein